MKGLVKSSFKSISPDEILSAMSVDGPPHRYQIGCLSQSLTVYSQQIRATNLIWALESAYPGRKFNIGIVGGGFTGVTCATAAQSLGWTVTLYERTEQLMHLQRDNRLRFLHPNIADWPAHTAFVNYTQLPFLNWLAGYPKDVVARVEKQWKEIKSKVNCYPGHRVASTSFVNEHWFLTIDGKDIQSNEHDIIVLAIGYGLETKQDKLAFKSYWHNDDLSQPVFANRKQKYLVSGCGDGGLTDALRLCLIDFDHEDFIDELVFDLNLSSLGQRLATIDEDVRQISGPEGLALQAAYDQLTIPPFIASALKNRIRKDTRVTLNSRAASPYRTSAATLNRLMVWILTKLGAIAYRQGEPFIISTDDHGLQVVFKREGYRPSEPVLFDHFVARHGTQDPLRDLVSEINFDSTQKKVRAMPRDFTREIQYSKLWNPTQLALEVRSNCAKLQGMFALFVFKDVLGGARDLAERFLERACHATTGSITAENLTFLQHEFLPSSGFVLGYDDGTHIACGIVFGPDWNTPTEAKLSLFSVSETRMLKLLDLQLHPYTEISYLVQSSVVQPLSTARTNRREIEISATPMEIANAPSINIRDATEKGMYQAHRLLPLGQCLALLAHELQKPLAGQKAEALFGSVRKYRA